VKAVDIPAESFDRGQTDIFQQRLSQHQKDGGENNQAGLDGKANQSPDQAAKKPGSPPPGVFRKRVRAQFLEMANVVAGLGFMPPPAQPGFPRPLRMPLHASL
jgi:hypothetical protein